MATIAGVGVEKSGAGKIDVAMQSSLYEACDAATNIFLACTGFSATYLTCQDSFQEAPDIPPDLHEQYPKVQTPRILVKTSNLYSLGLTLHKAHHLVKFDVDFLIGGDRQVLKTIYRIEQKEESFV